jgi:hypothetical protein
MKKSPIDDLFARKLADWESQPSSAAWERLQARQQQPKRRPIYWLAAATVLLALFVGYLAWQGLHLPSLPTENRLSQANSSTNTLSPSKEVAPLEVATAPEPARVRQKEAVASGEPTVQLVATRTEEPQSAATDTQAELPTALPIETQQTLPPQVLVAETKPVAVESELSPEATVEKPSAEPSRVVIARMALAEEEDAKPSKVIRMLRQLKNLKEGEEVNWEETGIAPKRLVARADSKLRDQEEKISKRYQQFKELTHF